MIEATEVLEAAKPLSYQRPVSQVATHLIHVEKITGPDGEVTEALRLNRKGKRKADALARRKFKPATRPLNKHELQQMMLNKYEDSLESKRPKRTAKRGKKKRPVTAAAEPEAQPADNPRQRRLAQRATERALQSAGL